MFNVQTFTYIALRMFQDLPFRELTTEAELAAITAASHQRPQVLIKHSTRCGISAYALHRMFGGAEELLALADVYVLDLLQHRNLSNKIAEDLEVYHQSPQLLVLQHGACTLELTHHEIEPEEVVAFLTGMAEGV